MEPRILKIPVFLSAFFLFLNGCSNTGVNTTPSIRVTAPALSSVVNADTTYTVRWNVTGTVDNTVKIDLYNDTGFIQSLAPSAANNGAFLWPVPKTVPGDTTYRIKITGATQSSVYGFSSFFTIVNNTDAWEPDDSVSQATLLDTSGTFQKHRISPPDTDWFKFEATGGRTYCFQTHGNADTYLWLYATNAFTILATNDNGGVDRNALVVWTCISSGTYFFKVTSPSRSLSADYTIDVRSGGAIIAITNPVSGTSDVQSGSTLPINWAFSTNAGTTVSLFAYRNDTVACLIATSAYNDGAFSWTIPWTLATSPAYRVKIVSDNDTSIHDVSDQFTITKIPSTLTITTPTSVTRWSTGLSSMVRWTYSGNFGSYVKLDLYDSSTFVSTISSGYDVSYGSYNWNIPQGLSTSSRYRIKIATTNDTSLYDYSDQFTITKIPSTVTITTPSASTGWTTGMSYTIYWTSTGNPGAYVNLALYDGTRLVSNFNGTFYTSNGSCNWTIPQTVPTASTYRIRITSATDTAIYDFSDPFTITKVPITFTLTAPSATTNWNTGSSYTIYWTSTGNPGTNVALALYDSMAQVTGITSVGVAANGSYAWTIPPTIASGTYRIKIISGPDSTINNYSSYFKVTNVPTSIAVTTPGKSTVWNAGSSYYLYWSSTGSTGNYVTINLYNDSTPVQAISSYASAGNGSYSWSIPSTLPGSARYRIKVASYTYPSIASYSDYFTIVQVPSRLTITTPNSSSSWHTGNSYPVSWTYAGAPGPSVRLDVYDSSMFVQTIFTSASTTAGSLSWLVPSSMHSSSRYQIKITSTTVDTVFNLSNFFTITNIPAGITVGSPVSGLNWNAGSSYSITWSSSGAFSGSYVSVSLYDSASFISTIASSVYRTYNNYSWQVPITQRGGNKFRVRVASTTDTTVAGYSGFFTIVPAAPRLTITTPDATTSWTVGYSYSVYWSYSGSPGSNVKIELFDTTALVQAVSSNVYTSNGSLLWRVPTSLPSDNRYRIKITSTTMDTVYGYSNYFQIVNPSVGDSYEPDSVSTLAKPVIAGTTAQDHTLTSGDKDWLSFGATGGASYTMETSGNLDTYMNLFSTDGTTLISSDDDGGTGYNAKIIWTCTTTGTYYFEVIGISGSVGNYAVSVR